MKTTLTVKTPHGTFTRTTKTKYTYVVVRKSQRAIDALQSEYNSGLEARFKKDNGFAVTWHSTHAAAQKSAQAWYGWDPEAVVLGIYEVASEKPEKPAPAQRIFFDLSGKVIIK